jgi:hypothetical protein
MPVNRPVDTDGDGNPDWMRVTCLYDGDAACSIEDDIDAAVKALNDTGGSTLQITAGVYDFPGNGVVGSGPAYVNSNGAIEPPVNMRIACDRGAVLVGPDETEDKGLSVIYSTANGVEVRGCEIDGGAPASYSWTALGFSGGTARMGVYLEGDDVVVDNNYIHDTFHACAYYRNGDGAAINQNQLQDCGGANATDTALTQPCAYIFADGAPGTTRNVLVSNNIAKGCGTHAYNTRIAAFDDVIENVAFVNNIATDIQNAGGVYGAGLSLSGSRNVLVDGLIVDEAQAAFVFVAGDTYLDEAAGGTLFGNKNVTLTAVQATNVGLGSGWGINLAAYQENVTMTNSVIDTTPDGRMCVSHDNRNRKIVYSGMTFSNCGGHGVAFQSHWNGARPGGAGSDPAAFASFRGIQITDPDSTPAAGSYYSGITSNGFVAGPHTFENIYIKGATAPGIHINSQATSWKIRDVTVSGLRTLFQGALTEASVPACTAALAGAHVITTNASSASDCDMASGTGTTDNECACDGVSWANMLRSSAHGIRVVNGPSTRLMIDGVSCDDIIDDAFSCVFLTGGSTSNAWVSSITGFNTLGLNTSDGMAFQAALDINAETLLTGAPTDVACEGSAGACSQ